MEWSFAGAGAVQAEVELPSGEIELRPVGDGELRVSLAPFGSGGRRAEELIEASEVSFAEGRLRVHVPQRPFRSTGLKCTILLPSRSSVRARTASADIQAGGTLGDFSSDLASGDVDLGRIEGELVFTGASGDLRCEVVTGRLKVKGASSDVSVKSVGGPAEITLASGDVRIGDLMASLRAATASGEVELGCVHAGKVSVQSASGDISIKVAPGVGAYLDLTSLSGQIDCELPMNESLERAADLTLSCRTMSGDVRISAAAVGAGSLGHD
jgi:DUF4097 and DUF4098 domain-containing protein YvlB